jgi:hypothetical protein
MSIEIIAEDVGDTRGNSVIRRGSQMNADGKRHPEDALQLNAKSPRGEGAKKS